MQLAVEQNESRRPMVIRLLGAIRVVFGSLITDKHEPNDVDVFMIMDDNFDMGSLVGEPRLLFVDHGTAQDHFGASVFWMRRMAAIGGEQAAIED